MGNFFYHYQHLPEKINPLAFSWGYFSLNWYSLMYLMALATVFALLFYRIKKGEAEKILADKKTEQEKISLIFDFLIFVFLGLLIGARLGYVIFYNPGFYFSHPLAIISPFDNEGNLVGIYGMSYHGGLLGSLLCGYWFLRRKKIDFWGFSDFLIPAIPAGYFWGRLGNFLNGELYGRVTERVWGMYFPADFLGLLRHPSQLYEAFLEGAVLFLIFWPLRGRKNWQGKFLALYLIAYGASRFILEFFRDPDPQLGFIFRFLTMGQLLSLAMIFLGSLILARLGEGTQKW